MVLKDFTPPKFFKTIYRGCGVMVTYQAHNLEQSFESNIRKIHIVRTSTWCELDSANLTKIRLILNKNRTWDIFIVLLT